MKREKSSTKTIMFVSCSLAMILRCLVPFILLSYLVGLWMTNMNVNHSQLDPPPAPVIIPSQQAITTSKQALPPGIPREPKPRPPLQSIVQGWNVTGDPSWLLNLAIIGFPKTGTSTLMKYLDMAPQVQVFDEERCEMGYNQHVRLMESLYRDMPPGDVIRGIKCPRDLEIPMAIKNYHKFFPNTDFMVGVRHPILWFESFYNFRVNNYFTMPPAETLLGRCTRRHQGVCTFRGNFHLFLANLGKTNILTDPQEQALIPTEYLKAIKPIPLKGRIFLWDISQLKPDNNSHDNSQQSTWKNTSNTPNRVMQHSHAQFLEDLRQFLRLETPLPDMIWVKPGYTHSNATIERHVESQKIDICEDRYQELRNILLQQGKLAARWIRTYFLEAKGVVVSQKEYFCNVILKSWEQDPCILRRANPAA